MPLFLIPFVILAAGNTRMHKHQADAALMDAETRRMEYNLHVAEYNSSHPGKRINTPAPRATLVKKH